MPELTTASAICLISVSLMLQPKVFQEFQPSGGVRATPLSSARAGPACSTTTPPAATSSAAHAADRTRHRTECFMLSGPFAVRDQAVERTRSDPRHGSTHSNVTRRLHGQSKLNL